MSRRRSLRRKQQAALVERELDRWPIGEGIQTVVDLHFEPFTVLDDDCPICRALRESGEPVFTIGPFGELVPVDVSATRRDS